MIDVGSREADVDDDVDEEDDDAGDENLFIWLPRDELINSFAKFVPVNNGSVDVRRLFKDIDDADSVDDDDDDAVGDGFLIEDNDWINVLLLLLSVAVISIEDGILKSTGIELFLLLVTSFASFHLVGSAVKVEEESDEEIEEFFVLINADTEIIGDGGGDEFDWSTIDSQSEESELIWASIDSTRSSPLSISSDSFGIFRSASIIVVFVEEIDCNGDGLIGVSIRWFVSNITQSIWLISVRHLFNN